MAPPKTEPLPTARDYGETMNKMNMLLARHTAAMTALRRPKPSTSKPATEPTKTSPRNSAKKSAGFSSLSTKSTAALAATSARRDDLSDEEGGFGFGPLNAGVGYVSRASAAAAAAAAPGSAETRDLRGKLLGKRAREQREDAAAARRRRKKAREESSDEEEGRSKIGKARKARKVRGSGNSKADKDESEGE